MSVYEKLKACGVTLPAAAAPVAAFVPTVSTGKLVFVSGHVAKKDGKPWSGKLGRDLSTKRGAEAARGVAIDLLATLDAAVGDLNRIRRIVKLTVLVNSTAEFTEQHLVANGASELFGEIFGAAGLHTRCSFGVSQAPFGACVEIEMVAEVEKPVAGKRKLENGRRG